MATDRLPAEGEFGRRFPDGVPYRTLTVTLGLAALAAAFYWDYTTHGPTDPTVMGWDFTRLDWLFLASSLGVACYVLWPMAREPGLARRRLLRLRRNQLGFAAGLFLLALVLTGLLGPVLLPAPEIHFAASNQPPVYTTVGMEIVTGECLNPQGSVCAGTWRFPLGTMQDGTGVLKLTVVGTRLFVELAVVAVAVLVPLAAFLGAVPAVLGGRVDRFVTGLVDAQRAVPALFAFLVYRGVVGKGPLIALVLVFGVVNSARVATTVYARAREEVAREYVTAARSAGAGPWTVARNHVVPNVSHTAVSAALLQIPTLVVLEATLTYLNRPSTRTGVATPTAPLLTTPPTLVSWGKIIATGMNQFMVFWWRAGVPLAALLLTVVALNVFGDALRDVLDPT